MTNKQTDLITITPFDPIGADERGTTSSFTLPRKQDQFVFLTRKAGSISGNTYHEGKNEATNPKIFLLLAGTINFTYRKVTEQQVHQETVQAPAKIEVSPYVTHQVEVIDEAVFLECNSITDIQTDRTRENVELQCKQS